MKFRIVQRHVSTREKDYWFIQYKKLFWWKDVTCDMVRMAGFNMVDGSIDYTLIDPGFWSMHRIAFDYDTAIKVALKMKHVKYPVPIYDKMGKIGSSVIIVDEMDEE